MDAQNAHVDGDGMYHYYGIPEAVTCNLEGTLFAYAADGFEIHYIGGDVLSSYQLKEGVLQVRTAIAVSQDVFHVTVCC